MNCRVAKMSERNEYLGPYASFMARIDLDQTQTEMLEAIAKERKNLGLARVQTCLAIGTSVGLREIDFIKRFMPDLRSFTAVEPDAPAVKKLRINLQLQLPHMETTVHPQTGQDFISALGQSPKPYDVVLLFHCLYHFAARDRQILFKAIFEKLLQSDGSLIIFHQRNTVGDMIKMMEYFDPDHAVVGAEQLKEELLSTGFQLSFERECSFDFDLSDPDDGLAMFFANCVTKPVSLNELKVAIKRFCPTGKSVDNERVVFMLFKKL
jgi:hypothetical protein